MIGRFSLEIAGESQQLRKRISASFDHWQPTIATVIGEAVAPQELPAGTGPESPADYLLNSWEGVLLRSQADKATLPSKPSCATFLMGCERRNLRHRVWQPTDLLVINASPIGGPISFTRRTPISAV